MAPTNAQTAIMDQSQIPQPELDLSAGLVSKPTLAASAEPLDLSSGLVSKTPSQPEAQAGPVSRLIGSYESGSGVPPGTPAEYMQNLYQGGRYMMQHPVDSVKLVGKSMLDAQAEQAKKAFDAYSKGDYSEAIARALYSGIPVAGPILAHAGEQIQNKDLAGATGTILSVVMPGLMHKVAPTMAEGLNASLEKPTQPTPVTGTLEQTAQTGLPLQQAGERIQEAAKEQKQALGAQVGAAQEAVQQAAPTAKFTIQPDTRLYDVSQQLINEAGGKSQLVEAGKGAKEPASIQIARKIVGQDENGEFIVDHEPPSWSYQDLKAERANLRDMIDGEKNPDGSFTAEGRRLIQLKQALQNDEYAFYEKNADTESAKTLQDLRKAYANLHIKDAATGQLRNLSPEKIVTSIVNQGPRAQSLVEDLLQHVPDEADQKMLQDSVLKEIYRTNPAGDVPGNVDAVKAYKKFQNMGDTAKSLFGDRYDDINNVLKSASDLQESKLAKATSKARIKRAASDVTGSIIGGTLGGSLGGPVGAGAGAVAGGAIADKIAASVFKLDRSGALKIGISPRETITISPTDIKTPKVADEIKNFTIATQANDEDKQKEALENIEKITTGGENEAQTRQRTKPGGAAETETGSTGGVIKTASGTPEGKEVGVLAAPAIQAKPLEEKKEPVEVAKEEPLDLSAGLETRSIPDLLEKAAEVHNIPKPLLMAQAKQESGLKQEAVSPKGATGVMQLMPRTASDLNVDPNDVEENIEGGAEYMQQLFGRFNRWDKALAAYNWGPDKVEAAVKKYGDDWLNHAPKETQDYVKNILKRRTK